jgi:hypothetical protein
MVTKTQKALVRSVAGNINNIFDNMTSKLLSPSPGQKFLSLEGMYDSSTRSHGFMPDKDSLSTLKKISQSYIDALRNRTIANVMQIVQASFKKKSFDLEEGLRAELSKAESELRRIVETETNKYKAIAQLDNIVRRAALRGNDDPYVYFEVLHDDPCEECKRIHLDASGKPRLYKVSELSHAYHKRGNDDPCVMGLHPNCRCELHTVGE